MSSIIEGYNYDIFISYRQKDNKYDGWVTEYVDNLKKELEATFKEEVSVYFDINPHDGLLETHDVDASLKEKLKCLVFIPIISRTYCDPKSFAWEHEFKVFVEEASQDQFGLKVKLPNGNVASRVLPVRIHDLDAADIKECESVLGGFLRGVEFIYKEPGVNKPLTADDDENKNLNKTKYRIQINKVANAVDEIISGLTGKSAVPVKEKKLHGETSEEVSKEAGKGFREKLVRTSKRKLLMGSIVLGILLIVAGILVYPKLFKKSGKTIIEKSVALMPFKNLTGNVSNDYLAEMQHEALYQELGKISQVKPLRVVGPQTTSTLENNRMSLSEIARDARVDYLVKGSVLSTGDLEEIMIQLIQIFPEERLVWANNYNSDRKNIHIVHSTVAGQIAEKIGLDLLPQDRLRLSQPRQVNPQSLEAYTRGMTEIEKRTEEGTKKGLEYLLEAVRIAPEDAFANAGLALGYLTIAHNAMDPGDALPKGEEYAFKAMMLDSTIAEVHAALAIAYLYRSYKFAEAEKHFKRALELNPNLDMAHYHYAWGLYLWGRMDEAIAEHKLAQKYDPYNPMHTAWLGGLYNYAGRNEEAIQEALKSLEIQKDYPLGYSILGRAYLDMGRYEEAIKTHQKLSELNPNQPNVDLCHTYIKTGHLEEAEKILAEIKQKEVTPLRAYNLAGIYASLGRKDEAFKWLKYEPHSVFLAWAAVVPFFESLHGDPRWDEFVKKLNLPKK
jgi:TolB-like protein/Flp pilus assembly protein TadD/6-pyruvoyl-tetrahydropterin synthase